MLDYAAVRNWDFGAIRFDYGARDTVLYALGAGLGMDPTDDAQLRFVVEQAPGGLRALPSMAAVMGSPGTWYRDPRSGIDWVRMLHGEQDLEILRPLPVAGSMVGRNRVTALHDRGAGRGALMALAREIVDAETGEPVARGRRIEVMRGDGGFGATCGGGDPRPPALPPIPADAGPPTWAVDLPTSPQAALIYRLSGDVNPLHADPATARAASFDRPILHGLGSFAIATHAVLRGWLDYDATRLRRIGMRFTAPVYPGETLQVAIWRETPDRVRFRASVPGRGTVLDNGIAEAGSPAAAG